MEGVEWINLISGQGQVVGACKHGHEPSGSVKCRDILD